MDLAGKGLDPGAIGRTDGDGLLRRRRAAIKERDEFARRQHHVGGCLSVGVGRLAGENDDVVAACPQPLDQRRQVGRGQ